jgi:hypothetical protein
MTKPPTKAEIDARKAFRQVDANMAMTEQESVQKAFSDNRERLKAERLAREAAAAPPSEKQAYNGKKEITSIKLKPGDRVRLNELGASRSPKIRVRTGTVVALPSGQWRSTSVSVLLDGNKRPTNFHYSYIELDDSSAERG